MLPNKCHLNRDWTNDSIPTNRRTKTHEENTKKKNICLSGQRKLGNHQGIQGEIQSECQQNHQHVPHEVFARDACLDLMP